MEQFNILWASKLDWAPRSDSQKSFRFYFGFIGRNRLGTWGCTYRERGEDKGAGEYSEDLQTRTADGILLQKSVGTARGIPAV